MNLEKIYRSLILEHSNNPLNVYCEKEMNLKSKRGYNPACGDDSKIFIEIKNNIITKLKHQTKGCAICTASASIITSKLENLEKEKALKLANDFAILIKDGIINDKNMPDEFKAFLNVYKLPARVKCALLPVKTIIDLLNE